GLARICDQAAVAERARSEFRTVLKPPDHLLIGEQLCRVAADILALHGIDLDAHEEFLQLLRGLLIAVAPADIGMIHDEVAAPLQDFEPAVISAADRNAVVTGRGLYPDVLKTRFAGDPPVRHAVQRDAAGHAEVLSAGA